MHWQPVPGRNVLDWIRFATQKFGLSGLESQDFMGYFTVDLIAVKAISLCLLLVASVRLALKGLACRSRWCRLLQPLSAWDILDWIRSAVV